MEVSEVIIDCDVSIYFIYSKRSQVFEKVNSIAPMVQSLLEEVRRIPTRLRESYIKQWKRSLVKRALALIKYIEDET